MDEQEIYSRAVALWGKTSQTDLAIEECSELIKSIIKYRRNKCFSDEIIEEMVDVQIMLHQLRIIYNDGDMYNMIYKKKLSRLEEMVK